MSTREQLERIKVIISNENTKTCMECNLSYVPMKEEFEVFCPECQESEARELRLELERVGMYE